MKRLTLFIISIIILTLNIYAQQDVKGSKNVPYISRFKDSKISWQEEKNYDRYYILKFYKDKIDTILVEGKILRTQYEVNNNHSSFEIYKSYKNSLKNSGFTILNHMDEKGGYSGAVNENLYNDELGGINPLPRGALNTLYNEHYSYLVAKKQIEGKNVYVVIFISKYKAPLITLDLIEEKSLDNNMVNVPSGNTSNNNNKTNPAPQQNQTIQNSTIATNNNTDKKYNKFEVEVFVNFWIPLSLHLKGVNSVMFIMML